MPPLGYQIGVGLRKRGATFRNFNLPETQREQATKLAERLPQGWKVVPVERFNTLREANDAAREQIDRLEDGAKFLAIEVEGEQELHILRVEDLAALDAAEVDGDALVAQLRP
ncbi:MAG: hypothetical protein HQ596_04920 [Candidatus Saganbacteria bacterium]|nr:hypothetical protein [Candidatus Saganbacteria bacterium]